MRAEVPYTRHHPKWYRRRVSVWWWLQKGSYTWFVLRELTSVFVALTAVVTLGLLWALGQGPEAYARFLARLSAGGFIALHAVAMVFVLFHAVTWFHLAPKAMVVRVRGKRIPGGMVVAMNYAAWVVLSVVAAWAMLRG